MQQTAQIPLAFKPLDCADGHCAAKASMNSAMYLGIEFADDIVAFMNGLGEMVALNKVKNIIA